MRLLNHDISKCRAYMYSLNIIHVLLIYGATNIEVIFVFFSFSDAQKFQQRDIILPCYIKIEID